MKLIKAIYTGRCAETKKIIPINEICLYNPVNKKVYHLTSKTYEKFLKDQKQIKLQFYANATIPQRGNSKRRI